MEQTDLRTHWTFARLAFADHVHGLVAGDGAPSAPEGAEMLTGVDPPLDRAVVLLEHVIQIWHRPMPAILGQSAFAFELRDGGRIRGVAVGVDDSWRGTVRAAQRFDEKALGRDTRVKSADTNPRPGESPPVQIVAT